MQSNTPAKYASPKIREDDYAAVRRVTEEFPISAIDAFTAMRLAWDSSPKNKQLELIKQVRRSPNRLTRGRPRSAPTAA